MKVFLHYNMNKILVPYDINFHAVRKRRTDANPKEDSQKIMPDDNPAKNSTGKKKKSQGRRPPKKNATKNQSLKIDKSTLSANIASSKLFDPSGVLLASLQNCANVLGANDSDKKQRLMRVLKFTNALKQAVASLKNKRSKPSKKRSHSPTITSPTTRGGNRKKARLNPSLQAAIEEDLELTLEQLDNRANDVTGRHGEGADDESSESSFDDEVSRARHPCIDDEAGEANGNDDESNNTSIPSFDISDLDGILCDEDWLFGSEVFPSPPIGGESSVPASISFPKLGGKL